MQRAIDSNSSSRPQQKLGGLLLRRVRWTLSWKGWVVLVLFIILVFGFMIRYIYPFLSVTEPVKARCLVVEGWVHDYAIAAAAAELSRGDYQQILTTGGPVQGAGRYINDFNTSASVAAERLVAIGVPKTLVHMVPSRSVDRDRTYSAALALKHWMQDHLPGETSITILTEDLHARRTRLLYQLAFGDQMKIGIIAVPNPDYDARHWWRYSEGVREVLGETIAYLYARLIFSPPGTSDSSPSDARVSGLRSARWAKANVRY